MGRRPGRPCGGVVPAAALLRAVAAALLLVAAPMALADEVPGATIAGDGTSSSSSTLPGIGSGSGAGTADQGGATTLTGAPLQSQQAVPQRTVRRAAPGNENVDSAGLEHGGTARVLVTFRGPVEVGTIKAAATLPPRFAAGAAEQKRSSSGSTSPRLHALAALKRSVLENVTAALPPGDGGNGRGAAPIVGGELRMVREFPQLPVSLVAIDSASALEQLRAHPDVAHVEPDALVSPALRESLPLINQPLALALVEGKGDGGRGCTIAVIDSGIDHTLPEFGSCSEPGAPPPCRVAFSADVTEEDDGEPDAQGHGTYVAAVAAAVAPAANLVALDILGPDGKARVSSILAALDWVMDNREQYSICSAVMSVGGDIERRLPCGELSEAAPLAALRTAGVIVAVASGNEGFSRGLTRPACVPAAVSVGAVYDADLGPGDYQFCKDPRTAPSQVACYSNSASFLTMLAPGDAISVVGTVQAGTSLAAPHVAGAAAVLAAAAPDAKADEIVTALTVGGAPVRDARNAVVKPLLDLAVSATLLECGMAVTFNSRVPRVYTRRITVGITTLKSPPNGATVCASDTSGSADSCCNMKPFTRALPFDLTSPGDGSKTVHVFLRSGPSCSAPLLASASASVTLDTRAPGNMSVSIVGGANITTTPSVVVLVAADEPDAVEAMCVQTSAPNTRRLPGCSRWEPFAATRDVTLTPRVGTHRVRVSLRDNAGKVAAAETSVKLDNVAPRQRGGARVKVPPKSRPGSGGASDSLTITWTPAKDTGVGLAGYLLTYQQGTATPPERCATPPGSSVVRAQLDLGPSARTATIDGLAAGTVYTLRLCAVDAAGNISLGVTVSAKTAS